MPLRVVVIVEGHGEDASIRRLLERIWYELLSGDFIEVIPWRSTQGRLRQKEGLGPVVEAAAIKLHATERTDLHRLLLVLIDTESEECPKTIAPERIGWAREIRSDPATEIVCVMPNPMFETWFALPLPPCEAKMICRPTCPSLKILKKRSWAKLGSRNTCLGNTRKPSISRVSSATSA
jgi:hypothetical protein